MADEVLLKIQADIKDLKAKIKQIESDFSGSSKKIQSNADAMSNRFKAMGNVLKIALSAAVLYKFKQGIQECIKAALKQEAVTRSLVSIMNTMKTATAEETKELIRLSEAMQKSTTFADDEIQAAMAMAGTFKLTAEQIKQVIPRAMDMAAAIEMMTGREMNLAEVTNMIGKSINGTIGFLTRYGVVIDENAIKSDKFSGIMKSLDDNFKGQAKTLTETNQGALKQLGNEISDVKEKIGGMFLPALKDITSFLKNDFIPVMDKVVSGVHKFGTMLGAGLGIAKVKTDILNLKLSLDALKYRFDTGQITYDTYYKQMKHIVTQIKFLEESLEETGKELIDHKDKTDAVVGSYKDWNKVTQTQIETMQKFKAPAGEIHPEPIISELEPTIEIIDNVKRSQDALNKSWADGIQYVIDLGDMIDIMFSKAANKGQQMANLFWTALGGLVGFAMGGPEGAGIGARIGAGIGRATTSSVSDRRSAELSNRMVNSKTYTTYQIGV